MKNGWGRGTYPGRRCDFCHSVSDRFLVFFIESKCLYLCEKCQEKLTDFIGKDAQEKVKHGFNVDGKSGSLFRCSECGWEDYDTLTATAEEYNYCPGCGAKMDGKKEG